MTGGRAAKLHQKMKCIYPSIFPPQKIDSKPLKKAEGKNARRDKIETGYFLSHYTSVLKGNVNDTWSISERVKCTVGMAVVRDPAVSSDLGAMSLH